MRLLLGLLSLLIFLPQVLAEEQETTFDPGTASSGLTMEEEACNWPGTSLWVVADGKGECIRYFQVGLEAANPSAYFFIHGDFDLADYALTEQMIRQRIRREQRGMKGPLIWISRPGIAGSSGNFLETRRTLREARLVNEAITRIKEKYRIGTLDMAGQSSGGRLVALLLTMRDDIRCAVSASAGLALEELFRMKDHPYDPAFIDPLSVVDDIRMHEGLRIFIVGSSTDRIVPFQIQEIYYQALRLKNIPAVLIDATERARGPSGHQLDHVARFVTAKCANGASDSGIVNSVTPSLFSPP